MKVYRERKPEKLFRILAQEKKGQPHDEVYISARPTIPILDRILEVHPNLKKLYCPPSLYLQTGKHTFARARELGVEILGGPFQTGRPPKYSKEDISRIISKWKAGVPVKRISEELGIPLRTVYFYIQEERA